MQRPGTSNRFTYSFPFVQRMLPGSVNKFDACAEPVALWHWSQWHKLSCRKLSSASKQTAPHRQLPVIFFILVLDHSWLESSGFVSGRFGSQAAVSKFITRLAANDQKQPLRSDSVRLVGGCSISLAPASDHTNIESLPSSHQHTSRIVVVPVWIEIL